MDFQTSLANGISNNPAVSPYYAGQVLKILNAPDSLLKRLALKILQNHTEAAIKDDPNTPRDATGAIDWSKVDWTLYLEIVLKILVAVITVMSLVA